MKLILTCEHGGNVIPIKFEHLFPDSAILQSHRGFDLGALDVFNHLKPLAIHTTSNETSRLLIELNRSLHHKNLFSEYSKTLSKPEKEHLISDYYLIYRNEVETVIGTFIQKKETVLHFSVHSFTPNLNGKARLCDIGLLYDPKRHEERAISKQLKASLLRTNNSLDVRFNYPYLGTADGFTTYLRKRFPNGYLGIELEINQKYANNNIMSSKIKSDLFKTIQHLNEVMQ